MPCFLFRSRKENLQLSSDYNKLQESYRELEALKDKLEHKEILWKSNMTDAQKEAEQAKQEVSVSPTMLLLPADGSASTAIESTTTAATSTSPPCCSAAAREPGQLQLQHQQQQVAAFTFSPGSRLNLDQSPPQVHYNGTTMHGLSHFQTSATIVAAAATTAIPSHLSFPFPLPMLCPF